MIRLEGLIKQRAIGVTIRNALAVVCSIVALTLISALASAEAENLADQLEPHFERSMMPPLLGPYMHTREASGTAWEPDSAPMEGMHFGYGDWSMMTHGNIDSIYNDQGGKRGADKSYSTSMAMFMASHSLYHGTFGFRSIHPSLARFNSHH